MTTFIRQPTQDELLRFPPEVRDLIKKGVDYNEEVEIDELDGTYIVKDKMNKRWRNKIDIYMGLDEEAAIQWGKRDVEITFSKDLDISDTLVK